MSKEYTFNSEEVGELIEFLRKEGLDPCDDAADLIEQMQSELSDLRYNYTRLKKRAKSYKKNANKLMAENAALREQLDSAHETLAHHIAGECACPRRTNPNPKAVHFPGCPIIAKEENEALRERVRELEGTVVQAIGWAIADACIAIDEGRDYRKEEIPKILERATQDLALLSTGSNQE